MLLSPVIIMMMGGEVGDYCNTLFVGRILDLDHIIGINNGSLLRCLIYDEICIVVVAHRYVDDLFCCFRSC